MVAIVRLQVNAQMVFALFNGVKHSDVVLAKHGNLTVMQIPNVKDLNIVWQVKARIAQVNIAECVIMELL